MGVAGVASLVVATSLLSSIATIYVSKIAEPQQSTVLVVSPDLNADNDATEQFVARALKSIDPDEADKHFKRARKVIKSWQSGNLALGNDLYKLKLVPGPVGPTGPTDDKFKNTKAGTAKAEKALVVDSNKDISGIRNIVSSGTVSAASVTATSGFTVSAGSTALSTTTTDLETSPGPYGVNAGAFVSVAITADTAFEAATYNGKLVYLDVSAMTASRTLLVPYDVVSNFRVVFSATAGVASHDVVIAASTAAAPTTTANGKIGGCAVPSDAAAVECATTGTSNTLTITAAGLAANSYSYCDVTADGSHTFIWCAGLPTAAELAWA